MRRLLPILLLLAACSAPEEPESFVALHVRFPTEAGDGSAAHRLEGSWSEPKEKGIWLLENGGTVSAALPELDGRLTLDVLTNEELAEAGQQLTVLVNDIELAQLDVAPWGTPKPVSFDIPAVWLNAEIDRIQLECSIHAQDEGKPLYAVWVNSLKLEQFGRQDAIARTADR